MKMPRLYDAQRGFRLLQSAHTSIGVPCEQHRDTVTETGLTVSMLPDKLHESPLIPLRGDLVD